MVSQYPDKGKVRAALVAPKEQCPDGCGLSAHECEGLYAKMVALATEILSRPPRSTGILQPLRKAA